MTKDKIKPRWTTHAKQTLVCVLDELIPDSSDGKLPGASALGLAEEIEASLNASPELCSQVLDGLAILDELSRTRESTSFAELSQPRRLEVLSALEAVRPDFLPPLVFRSYSAYYQNPDVLEALGLEARPPFPMGHEVDSTDFSLLDPVRQKSKLYRTV